jgi:hypothetical protein
MSLPVHADSTRWWKSKTALIFLNIVGGTAVLCSYVHGLTTHPLTRGDVWGGVPESLKPLYTVSMLCAAAGYFPFTYYILTRLDAQRVRIAGFGYGIFHVLYAGVLVFSALWMPLTFAMLEAPSLPLWYTIRLTLAIVGLASLAILAALLTQRPRETGIAYWTAVIGSVAFCVQTTLLDALVWPAFFPV